jgi:hypothetical protein
MTEWESEFVDEEVAEKVCGVGFKELFSEGLVCRRGFRDDLRDELHLSLHNHILILQLVVLESDRDDLAVKHAEDLIGHRFTAEVEEEQDDEDKILLLQVRWYLGDFDGVVHEESSQHIGQLGNDVLVVLLLRNDEVHLVERVVHFLFDLRGAATRTSLNVCNRYC